jgi:hypothetical protein
MFSPDRAALVLVDVQQALRAPSWARATTPRGRHVISGEPDLLVTKHVNSAFIGELIAGS